MTEKRQHENEKKCSWKIGMSERKRLAVHFLLFMTLNRFRISVNELGLRGKDEERRKRSGGETVLLTKHRDGHASFDTSGERRRRFFSKVSAIAVGTVARISHRILTAKANVWQATDMLIKVFYEAPQSNSKWGTQNLKPKDLCEKVVKSSSSDCYANYLIRQPSGLMKVII